MNEIENLVFWLKYKLVFGFLFITAYWYHWNFPMSLRAVCQWDKMGGAQSKLQMDWMRGDKMGGAQSQLQMSGRTNNVMVWYEWVRLYCGWVGRNVLVKLMWLYLRVGHDKLECGLCLGGIWMELRGEWKQEQCICYYKSHQNQKSIIVYMTKYFIEFQHTDFLWSCVTRDFTSNIS